MFAPMNENTENNSANFLYVDIHREFVHNTKMYLILEKDTKGVRGYE